MVPSPRLASNGIVVEHGCTPWPRRLRGDGLYWKGKTCLTHQYSHRNHGSTVWSNVGEAIQSYSFTRSPSRSFSVAAIRLNRDRAKVSTWALTVFSVNAYQFPLS